MVIIPTYNGYLFISDQVLSRNNTVFILVLYHIPLQGVICQNIKLQCEKFLGLFLEKELSKVQLSILKCFDIATKKYIFLWQEESIGD